MPDFEVFDKSHASTGHPAVTLLKQRVISMNRAAYDALDAPIAVELLYDRIKRIIGLRAVDAHNPHACFVRLAGHSANGPFLVSAMAFLGHYEIETQESRRWPAWFEDEVLCVALDEPCISVTSNRAGQCRHPEDPSDPGALA